MFGAVASPYLPRTLWIRVINQVGGCDNARRSKASRQVVCRVIETRCCLTEVEVARIRMANHRVTCVHGFVGHGEWDAAERHIEEWCDKAVAGAFGDRLDD